MTLPCSSCGGRKPRRRSGSSTRLLAPTRSSSSHPIQRHQRAIGLATTLQPSVAVIHSREQTDCCGTRLKERSTGVLGLTPREHRLRLAVLAASRSNDARSTPSNVIEGMNRSPCALAASCWCSAPTRQPSCFGVLRHTVPARPSPKAGLAPCRFLGDRSMTPHAGVNGPSHTSP